MRVNDHHVHFLLNIRSLLAKMLYIGWTRWGHFCKIIWEFDEKNKLSPTQPHNIWHDASVASLSMANFSWPLGGAAPPCDFVKTVQNFWRWCKCQFFTTAVQNRPQPGSCRASLSSSGYGRYHRHIPIQRWAKRRALGCKKFLICSARLLLSKTGPPFSTSLYSMPLAGKVSYNP